MSMSLIVLFSLCALPPSAELESQATRKVAVFDLRTPGLSEESGAALMASLTKSVSDNPGLQVVSRDEIATMLGLEVQKQMMGCDDTGCLAEIAGALDVDLLVSGAITPIGEGTVVTLQLINQRYANVMNRVSITWPGDQEQLPQVLEAAAQLLIRETQDRTRIRVQINDAPEDTEVFIDEKSLGLVDDTGQFEAEDIEVGVHALRLSASDYTSKSFPFVAVSGQNLSFSGELEPKPFHTTWWFWTGVGVLGAVTAVSLLAVAAVAVNNAKESLTINADPFGYEEGQ